MLLEADCCEYSHACEQYLLQVGMAAHEVINILETPSGRLASAVHGCHEVCVAMRLNVDHQLCILVADLLGGEVAGVRVPPELERDCGADVGDDRAQLVIDLQLSTEAIEGIVALIPQLVLQALGHRLVVHVHVLLPRARVPK